MAVLRFPLLAFVLCGLPWAVDPFANDMFRRPRAELMLVLGAVALVVAAGSGRLRALLRMPFSWWGLAFIGLGGVSATWSAVPGQTWEQSVRLIALFGLLALACGGAGTASDDVRLRRGLILTGTLQSLLLVIETFAPDLFGNPGGVRLTGLFGHPNEIAQFLVAPAVLAGHAAARERTWPVAPWLFGICLLGLGLTLTRGAWLATAVAVTVILVRSPGAGRKAVAGAVAGAILAGTALLTLAEDRHGRGSFVEGKANVRTLSADSGRIEIYGQSLDLVRESPWIGHGLGQYALEYERVDRGRGDVRRHAHSDPLELLAELGIAGLVIAGGAVFVLTGNLKRAGHAGPWGWVAGAVFLHAGVSYGLHMPVPSATLAVASGFLLVPEREPVPSRVWSLLLVGPSLYLAGGAVGRNLANHDWRDLESVPVVARYEASEKLLEHLGQDADLLWQRQHWAAATGNTMAVLDSLDDYITLRPYSVRAWVEKSRVLAAAGREDEARAALDRARELGGY